MFELDILRTAVASLTLVILYGLESVIPFYEQKEDKVLHATRNLSLAILNAVMIAAIFTSVTLATATVAQQKGWGLLNQFTMPLVIGSILSIILFDLWMYWWHRANHRIPLLWRLHRVHHTDKTMDVTTAVRFHPVEIAISSVLRIGIVLLLGLQVWQVALYELFLFPVIMLHHSNIIFPESIDRWYRLLFASPHLHRVHHSQIKKVMDNNYGSIFSFWDRLFGSFVIDHHQRQIVQGVKGLRQKKWDRLKGMLTLPFSRN